MTNRIGVLLALFLIGCGDVSAMMGSDASGTGGAAGTGSGGGQSGGGGAQAMAGSGGSMAGAAGATGTGGIADAGLPPMASCLGMACGPSIHDACRGYVNDGSSMPALLYCVDEKYVDASKLPAMARCTIDKIECWSYPWPSDVPCSMSSDCKSGMCLKGSVACPAGAQYGDCLCI